MSVLIVNSAEDQARRQRHKSQEARLAHLAVEGAGISPWEADVLVDVVNEVYFAEPEERPLQAGQMRYVCVAASEGAGWDEPRASHLKLSHRTFAFLLHPVTAHLSGSALIFPASSRSSKSASFASS
jgi:hypothetical protein